MTFQIRCTALLVALGTCLPAGASAQQPWAVTVVPTTNPLPIGVCAAVFLTLADPRTKDRPRNPAGLLIGLADFDMDVVPADSTVLVGRYNGPNNWVVCACPGAGIGTIATVTATYPATTLAPAARVPGVTFSSSTTITISALRSSTTPLGCKNVSQVATVPTASPGQAQPLAGAATTGRTPVPVTAAPRGTPARPPSTSPPTPLPPGPSTPRAPPGTVASPPMVNPSGFTATDRGLGNVDFQWQPVANAVRYRVNGPGIAASGAITVSTSMRHPKIPAGPQTFKLTTIYAQNRSDSTTSSTASTVVRVLPSHSQPWLSKAGPASAKTVQTPKNTGSSGNTVGRVASRRG